jgi:hypothetical protein
MKMSDGGKGGDPRPFAVDRKTFEDNWKAIEGFGESWLERKARLEREAKEFDEKVVMKEEYYDQE